MRAILAISVVAALAGCAQDSHRPTEDTAKRMLAERCPAGYVEYPAGSGYCEPYDPAQQQQGPIRQTLSNTMSQPMPRPAVGGLRR